MYSSKPSTVLGIQMETTDLRTAVMEFPKKEMAEEVDAFKRAMAFHWKRLYKDSETVTGLVEQGGTREVSYYVVTGKLYWPKAMRDRTTVPRASPNVSGLAPLPKEVRELMALDMRNMDEKEMRQWGVSMGKYLVRTIRQPETEGADDPTWRSQRLPLVEGIIKKVEEAEEARGGLFPTAGLYQVLGDELLSDQYSSGTNEEGEYILIIKDVDEGTCQRAMDLIDKALRTFPLYWSALNSKSIAYKVLGRQEMFMAYKRAFVQMMTAANRIQVTALAIGNAEIPNYKEARKHSKRAVKEISKQATAWYIHGSVLYKLGKHKKALKAFEECLKLEPDSVLGWFGKGLVLEAMGDPTEAADCFSRT
jgi:tetratricopeptide (TPR) repeat protein